MLAGVDQRNEPEHKEESKVVDVELEQQRLMKKMRDHISFAKFSSSG